MPRHNFVPPAGSLRTLSVKSAALAENLQGDPDTRSVAVYVPPGYDQSDADYPLLVGLAAFTGSGLKLLNWQSFGESVPQRIDRLVAQGAMGPTIVAFPDCFTSLGGNQYVNSVALGRWEDFLLDDMIPRLEAEFRVRPGAAHRAVFGHSSGGYGALIQGLRHGEAWAGVAAHSADMGFDLLYRPALPKAVGALAAFDGDIEAFLAALGEAKKMHGGQFYALMVMAMAASYDPRPEAPRGICLPVDLHTCELDTGAWPRWLAHDPLQLVDDDTNAERLRRLACLYIDCGSRDQYNLHFGNRILDRKLSAAGVEHIYEEFPDDHSKVDYRLDRSLPLLYEAVTR